MKLPSRTASRRPTEDFTMAQISRRAALLGIVGIGLAGCSKTSVQLICPPTPAPPPSPPPSQTPSPSPSVHTRPRWPLTGKLLKDEDNARHAAVAVKVPDNRWEHPQRGIDKADIVFVELEGYRDASGYSGTRLGPGLHSRMGDRVAAGRAVRPVDIPLLSPIHALIGNTGASRWVVNYVKHY